MRPATTLIGEQNLSLPQQRDLRFQRLFHLHDHLGPAVDRRGVGYDDRPGLPKFLIRDTAALPRLRLDQYPVPGLDQGPHPGRHHPHPVFVVLDFFRNSDDHGLLLAMDRIFKFETRGTKSETNSNDQIFKIRTIFSPETTSLSGLQRTWGFSLIVYRHRLIPKFK
jgi:hypothetical protein